MGRPVRPSACVVVPCLCRGGNTRFACTRKAVPCAIACRVSDAHAQVPTCIAAPPIIPLILGGGGGLLPRPRCARFGVQCLPRIYFTYNVLLVPLVIDSSVCGGRRCFFGTFLSGYRGWRSSIPFSCSLRVASHLETVPRDLCGESLRVLGHRWASLLRPGSRSNLTQTYGIEGRLPCPSSRE